MRKSLFDIPLFTYEVQNWKSKKIEIMSWLDKTTMSRSPANHFYSDRGYNKNNKFYVEDFATLFDDVFKLFQIEIGLPTIENAKQVSDRISVRRTMALGDIWFVEYEKGDYQLPHNHRSTGFTGILYVNFNEEKHPLTTVIQPWNGIFDDETKMINVDAEEGTLIIMPSNLLHFSLPNKSEHKKIVLSFDLTII